MIFQQVRRHNVWHNIGVLKLQEHHVGDDATMERIRLKLGGGGGMGDGMDFEYAAGSERPGMGAPVW